MHDSISLWWAVPCLKRLVTGMSPKYRVLSLISPCEICGGKSSTWTRFSPSTSSLPHSLSCRKRSIKTFICMLLVPEGQKRPKPENLPANNAVSGIWKQWLKKVLSLFYGLQRVKQLHFLYFQPKLQYSHKVNPKDSYSAVPLWTCIRDVFDSNTGLDWSTSSFYPSTRRLSG